MLTTEELAQRWGIHPESLKRAVRNGTSPVRPIIPGAGRWVFSLPPSSAGLVSPPRETASD